MKLRSQLFTTVHNKFPFGQGVKLRHACTCGQHTGSGGECAGCKKMWMNLQHQSASKAEPTTAPSIVHDVLRAPGRQLDPATRAFMEPRFGHDFSRVRVHTDAKAAESARIVNALAYTVGRDVVFGARKYAPETGSGNKLLAHELTHVVQQRNANHACPIEIGSPSTFTERGAIRVASRLGTSTVSQVMQPLLQRQSSSDDPFSTDIGSPSEGIKLPPRCSIGKKGGKWFWNCEGLPGIDSTPEIPLDPRDIPKEIEDLFRKKENGEPKTVPVFPTPGTGLSPDWLEELCKRNPLSPLCMLPGKKKDPGKKADDLTKPVGVFWTTDVHFEQNRPSAKESSPDGGFTSDGGAAVRSIISLLSIDPTLQVRLIGHASSEGSKAHNLALSGRRVQLVYDKLKAEKLGLQVMDPIKSDGKDTGCTQLRFGIWSCGEAGATQGEALAEERKVEATYLRNPPLPSGPLKVTAPTFGVREE